MNKKALKFRNFIPSTVSIHWPLWQSIKRNLEQDFWSSLEESIKRNLELSLGLILSRSIDSSLEEKKQQR
jgi:hypothetical protein